MDAHKCDRCGKYYDNNVLFKAEDIESATIVGVRARFYKNNNYGSDKAYDLCDDCIMDFYKWINEIVEE